jgi:hypothetical protein
LKRVFEIIDKFEKEVDRDSEYIAYDILDNDKANKNSVEALYSKAEGWV